LKRRFFAPVIAALVAGVGAFYFQAAAQAPAASIETAPLTQLDGWTVGAMNRGQGALPATLWRESDAPLLSALFDRLPTTIDSPAAQALARRALLSAGQAPRGDGATEAARKRFAALGRMGFADDLATMAAGATASVNDPAIAQYAAQAELARGRRAEACTRGRLAETETPPAFLLRLRAYCAAARGERAAADLALALIGGGAAEDVWFRAAVAGVGDGAPRAAVAARYDSSLNTSVSLAGGLRAGATPLANASTLALVTLARSEATPQPLRAQAAALAYRRGALTPAQAREVLAAAPATVTTGLAAALRAVNAAPATMGAATAIAGALRAANANPAEFTAAALLFRADIANLTAAPDAATTLLFARAALAAGDAALAERLIGNAAGANADRVGLAQAQAALAVLKNEATLATIQRRLDATPANGARAAARDVTILAALGAPADANTRAFLLANAPQGGRAADASAIAALTTAGERGAIGEAALLAALAAAPGANTLDAASLSALLRPLRAVELGDSARRIAVEALIFAPPA